MSVSLLTLVRGRTAHLSNLMASIALQTRKADELVIAWMQDEVPDGLPDPGIPVVHLRVPGDPMPLAAARNRAAEAATGRLLVFLDADCIASPGLVAAYRDADATAHGLFLGEVLYLPAGAAEGRLDFDRLDRLGQVHPSKPAIPTTGIRRETNAGELWGLSFALRRQDYRALGGMDEDFAGYGGEETDFAARLAAADLDLYWTAHARVYHQHHCVHVPPLQHFSHIVRNAVLFRQKHGVWCMPYWLGQFQRSGFIDWNEDTPDILVRRTPTAIEIAATLQPGTRLFS